jgi:hypothetical protein
VSLVKAAALVAAGVVVAGVLGGCSSGSANHPGNPDVYARINAMTYCAAPQQEFDQADANRSISSDPSIQTAYMEAADARMKEVGCYG